MDLNSGAGGVLVGNISPAGEILWTKILYALTGGYGAIDLVTYSNTIIVQGISNTTTYPHCAIFSSTKLNLATGELISSKSSRDHSTVGGAASYNSISILTDDYKIKTIVRWATPYFYMNHLSFTHDTSGNLIQHTVHHTQNLAM